MTVKPSTFVYFYNKTPIRFVIVPWACSCRGTCSCRWSLWRPCWRSGTSQTGRDAALCPYGSESLDPKLGRTPAGSTHPETQCSHRNLRRNQECDIQNNRTFKWRYVGMCTFLTLQHTEVHGIIGSLRHTEHNLQTVFYLSFTFLTTRQQFLQTHRHDQKWTLLTFLVWWSVRGLAEHIPSTAAGIWWSSELV